MMGRTMINTDTPANKRTSGVVMLPGDEAKRGVERNCIRCGKCIDACPMGLEPYLLATMSAKNMNDELEQHYIYDCIECGCCTFTCPSNRPLLDYIRQGKATVMGIMKSRTQKK